MSAWAAVNGFSYGSFDNLRAVCNGCTVLCNGCAVLCRVTAVLCNGCVLSSPTHSHSLTHSHQNMPIIHSLTDSLTDSLPLSLTPHPLTHSLPLSDSPEPGRLGRPHGPPLRVLGLHRRRRRHKCLSLPGGPAQAARGHLSSAVCHDDVSALSNVCLLSSLHSSHVLLPCVSSVS